MSESDDPLMAGLRSATPTTLFPSSPFAGAGKSSGGGMLGGEEVASDYIAAAVTGRDNVGIIRLNAKAFITRYCGGLIGKGNRVCLVAKELCEVQNHKLKRFETDTDEDRLYIKVKDQEAVYAEPTIGPNDLEPHLERYLQELRPAAAWETLFRGIEHQPENERQAVEVERLAKRVDEDPVAYGMTPMKKKARFKADTTAMEAGYKLSVVKMQEDLDPANATFGAEFNIQWKAVIENIEGLSKVTQALRDHVLEVSQVTEEELDGHAYTVAKVSNLVGVRPSQLGTMTVFDCIRAASVEMDGLVQQLNPAKLAALDEHIRNNFPDTQSQFRIKILEQMSRSLEPVFKLYNSMSSDPSRPGDKIAHEIGQMQNELLTLQRELSQVKMGGASNHFGLGVGSPTHQQVPVQSNSTLLIEQRVQALEDQLKAVQVQLESKRVEIGGHIFRSRDEVRVWLTKEANTPGAYIYFVDAHSLINLATDHASSNTEVIQLQMNANRSGSGSTDEALVLSGFKLELPTFFGKDGSVNEASQDTLVLPGVKDFVAWDPPGGHSGARRRLDRQVTSQQHQMTQGARHFMTPSAAVLAQAMINQSNLFIRSMGTWMSQYFTDLVGKGGKPDNVWKLISHSVRAIFTELHMARSPGRGPFPQPMDKASGVMWGCLQAHSVMADFMEAGFGSHPKMSHILNLHLQEYAAMKDELYAVLARLNDVEQAVEKAQSTADSAKALAKKK